MDFFSCPCLLSELTDWIKGIGFPQTPRVIDISADQMQNTADLQHGSKDCYIILFFLFFVFLLRSSESFIRQKKTEKMCSESKLC